MSKRATFALVLATSCRRWGTWFAVAVVRTSSWIAATPPNPVDGSASAAPAATATAVPARTRRVLRGFFTGSFLRRGPEAAGIVPTIGRAAASLKGPHRSLTAVYRPLTAIVEEAPEQGQGVGGEHPALHLHAMQQAGVPEGVHERPAAPTF